MAFEKLAVLGVGAIGSTIGAYLARAGHDITLIDEEGAVHAGSGYFSFVGDLNNDANPKTYTVRITPETLWDFTLPE